MLRYNIDTELVLQIAEKGNFDIQKLDIDDLIIGMKIELEHGRISPQTNITDDDPLMTFKIVMAHVNEYRDYYKALVIMEEILKRDKLDSLIDLSLNI